MIMHVDSSTVIHYAKEMLYVTVRLQKAESVPFSAVAQQSNTFLQLLQDQANSSQQQVFLLVDGYFYSFPYRPIPHFCLPRMLQNK